MGDANNRKAVIDLGTNTFHLLIVETDENGGWREVYKQREYVYLAAGGMDRISGDAFDRGIQTLKRFREFLSEKGVMQFKAIGTAALRTASNRKNFIQEVKKVTGIQVEVIQGLKEAQFIAKGVDLAVGQELDEYLIMDIGGGSVEFIHKSKDEMNWEHSFSLGLAVLRTQSFYSDPMTDDIIDQFKRFIHKELDHLLTYLDSQAPMPLVGASGTFEALLQLIPSAPFGNNCRHYAYQELEKVNDEVKFLSLPERIAHPGIPKERAELFSLATLLVYTVAKELEINDIYISPYALKEGVLHSMK